MKPETDEQFHLRQVCPAPSPGWTVHKPKALLVHEALEDGRFTLRVRCQNCKRLGYVDIDLSTDFDGITWDRA